MKIPPLKSTRKSGRRKHLTYPVWAVLVVVVLFPVVGLTKGVVDEGLESKRAAEQAALLDSQVRTVTNLQLLNLLLRVNQMSEFAETSLAEAGLDLEVLFPDDANMAETLDRMFESRGRVTETASLLELDDPEGLGRVLGDRRDVLAEHLARLPELQARLDSGEGTSEDISETIGPLMAAVDQAAAEILGSLRSQQTSTDLDRHLRGLDSLMLSLRASVDEIVGVASLFLPGGLEIPGAEEPAVLVAASNAIGAHERNQFRLTAPRELLDNWEDLASADGSQRLAEIRTMLPGLLGLVDTDDAPPFDVIEYIGFALEEMDAVTNVLLPESLADVSAELKYVEAKLERDAERSFIEASVWMFVTMAVVIFGSRLLLRPLRLVSSRARDLTEGEVGKEPLGPMGAREIDDVGMALDEAHASLHLLRDQLGALADRRLDAPVLDRKVAGPIGEYVSQSVRGLSEATTQMHDQASTDRLTGLPNRFVSLERLGEAALQADESNPVAVVFLDLDRFKAANDSYGHGVGDQVLRVASGRFSRVLAQGDHEGFVGRLGGDEFLVVCTDVGDLDGAKALAWELVDVMSSPIAVDAIEVQLGASAGITMAIGEITTPSELLNDADLALYASKATGERVTACNATLKEQAKEKRDVSALLTAALGTPDVELHLQPLVDLGTGEIMASEALLRWTNDGRFMSPGWYIPLIESSTLIIDVGRWVLSEAAAMAAYLEGEVGREIPVSVNISWNHVTSGSLLADVLTAIDLAGIKPSQLRIELTETSPPNDIEQAKSVLSAIRELGVSLWLDDFGTGFTSITQLREFRFDVIKLDRSFVAEEVDEDTGGLAEALIEIARLVDVEVIAEGVEEPGQASRMYHAGCTWGQGWLWSKAVGLQQFAELAKGGPLGEPTTSAHQAAA